MALEREILPFWNWLLFPVEGRAAIFLFLLVVAGLIVTALFVAYVRMVLLVGPGEAFYAVAKAVYDGVTKDLRFTSLRRIGAIGRLAVQESLRRWVLVVFVVFALALLVAGWFLNPRSDHPAQLYLSFVLGATELLVLVIAVLLSVFSLPNDIKFKTIHTVVTKPVRASEIVFGRIVGFCAVNTALLLMTCLVSYLFVQRGLSHRHVVSADAVETLPASAGAPVGWKGVTEIAAHHRHELTIGPDGHGETDFKHDHRHRVTRIDEKRYALGPAEGGLIARIPVYGKMHFIGRDGKPDQGISVGHEWNYRRYIEGGSQAAAIWTFDGLTEQKYADGLPIEMTLSVFRTYKGDIVSGITGTLTLRNPRSGMESEPMPFTAVEYSTAFRQIPRQVKAVDKDGTLQDVDLFRLVDNGRLELQIQCSEPAQYFGMAQADLYLRSHDAPFFWNFLKAYLGIWMQMVILTCFGVVFSTFLSGSVAMFATVATYLVGLERQFVVEVATGVQVGGGALESAYRMLTQRSIGADLDAGPVLDRVLPWMDAPLNGLMWVVAHVLPDFRGFSTAEFVANGFNIDGNLLLQHGLTTLAYVLVLTIFGYFFLRSREIAG